MVVWRDRNTAGSMPNYTLTSFRPLNSSPTSGLDLTTCDEYVRNLVGSLILPDHWFPPIQKLRCHQQHLRPIREILHLAGAGLSDVPTKALFKVVIHDTLCSVTIKLHRTASISNTIQGETWRCPLRHGHLYSDQHKPCLLSLGDEGCLIPRQNHLFSDHGGYLAVTCLGLGTWHVSVFSHFSMDDWKWEYDAEVNSANDKRTPHPLKQNKRKD